MVSGLERRMDAYCTCGCALPDGAAFCMRCGRPRDGQVHEPPEPEAVEDAIESAESAAQTGPDFKLLLGIATMPAVLATVLRFVVGLLDPILGLLSFLIAGGAGFAAVREYERRCAARASTWLGCGLGALVGALCAVMSLAVQFGIVAMAGGIDGLIERIHRSADTLPWASEISGLLEDPVVVMVVLAFGWLLESLFLIAFSSVGGALGAKVRRSLAA